jgi:hypothetical protein
MLQLPFIFHVCDLEYKKITKRFISFLYYRQLNQFLYHSGNFSTNIEWFYNYHFLWYRRFVKIMFF